MKNIDSDKGAIDTEEKLKTQIDDMAYELIKESINTRTKKPSLKKTVDVPKFINKKIRVISSKNHHKDMLLQIFKREILKY